METSQNAQHAPDFAAVEAAAARLRGQAVRTPLLSAPELDEALGGRVLLKLENVQRTGSFKFRGAYNKISQIPEAERAGGVVAPSSGNHAQAVAEAARLFGMPALIVMPADAPSVKTEGVRARGGEVRPYDRETEDREAIARAIAAERGATLVRPYDDPEIIAGQGTAGLEICEDAAALGVTIDAFLCCTSGGGLTAGCALAFEAMSPRTSIYTVEPEGFDDTRRSLEAGERLANPRAGGSAMDALLVQTPGEVTFPINRRLVTGGLAVSDDDALDAVAFAARRLKLVVEPGGAAALAAVLSRKLDLRGKTVAVMISGGNIDPDVLSQALRRPAGPV